MNKGFFFFYTLVLLGLVDLGTTLIGITYFGANESNPLIAGVTNSSPLLFAGLKLLTTFTIGLMFYKAGTTNGYAANKFLQLSYSFSMIFMTYVVANNLFVIGRLI